MWINFKTEFSFGKVYGRIDDIIKKAASMADYAGIADLGNTFGHVQWNKACKKHGIKPIFGVQLPVVESLEKNKKLKARFPHNWMTFIARNDAGLKEIYELVDSAHKQFYYIPRISYKQVNNISHNIAVLSGIGCRWDLIKFGRVYVERSIHTPKGFLNPDDVAGIATIDNYYINEEDKAIYEPFADERKRERKTTLMHIPTKKEWLQEFDGNWVPTRNLEELASQCNATLPSAPMVKWKGRETIEGLCVGGMIKRNFNLSFVGLPEYRDRYNREIDIIKKKNFQDYFLVVADHVKYAKTKMFVGPARGSSAGSLVCYLLGITEVDPIEHDLLFERFIDLNRADLPDIDIDFPDDKRHLVIKYLERKYGKDNVAQLANISKLKPKSAINRFAKAFGIPLDEIEEIKNLNSSLKETFASDIGKAFLEKYPQMASVTKVENHASHTSVHAAGVIVGNKPISSYCGINSRDNQRIAMIDKRDAEILNLLKIDILGLRTLSIIAGVCDAIGKPYEWIHNLPIDDAKAFEIFNSHRFSGVFQFEGDAVRGLAMKMPFKNIDDIAALSALGRPGPLESGAAWDYVNARSGREPIKWISEHPLIKEITKDTFGVIVYQEQVMKIVREVGGFSWKDTSAVRKAVAKSQGDKIQEFRNYFVQGARDKHGFDVDESVKIWANIETFGGYAFNKSHAISYGLISYYCAYLKAHYPLEFTMACLNNSKDDNSALKILRDAVENEGVKYQYIDNNASVQKWSIKEEEIMNHADLVDPIKTLLGGFTSLNGIGPANATKIVKLREEGKPLPPGIRKHLKAEDSPFKYLYPATEVYGDYYTSYQKLGFDNPIITIEEAKKGDGTFNVIGKLIEATTRDANEAVFVQKRKGQYLSGNTAYLILQIEDDTDGIRCKIKMEDYNRLGREIAESGKKDKDWYVVCGEKINNWNILFVKNIKRITR